MKKSILLSTIFWYDQYYIYIMAKLPNAPLQEVIFEVRWTLQPVEESGQMQDAGLELAGGRLSTREQKQININQVFEMEDGVHYRFSSPIENEIMSLHCVANCDFKEAII